MKKVFSLILALSIAILGNAAPAAQSTVEKGTFKVEPGKMAFLPESFVRENTVTTFNVKGFKAATLGRGINRYRGTWFVIKGTEMTEFTRGKMVSKHAVTQQVKTFNLAKAIGPNAKISISVENSIGVFTVTSESGTETLEIKNFWPGGIPFIVNDGDKPFEVEISFDRKSASRPFWFVGDSYFNTNNPERWPYHMQAAGCRNWMGDHLPGGHSREMLESFKHDLQFGTPKFAVWTVGMNDPSDKDGEPNSRWLVPVQEFIKICKAKGITPVITVIPNVPKRNHNAKAEWARKSGVRYIDWAKAVNCDEFGNWDDGLLGRDNVHPTEDGAKALWKQILKDLPEIAK